MYPQQNSGVRLVVDQIKFTPKRKYLKDIANEYEVSTVTLWRWLKKNNIVIEEGSNFLTGEKQIEIYNKLGWPDCFLQVSAA